jgi:hypothetical protein
VGSFNMQCSLSKVDIVEGESCVAIPLKGLVNGEIWLVDGFPIYGTYNDYGTLIDANGTRIVSVKEETTDEFGYLLLHEWAYEFAKRRPNSCTYFLDFWIPAQIEVAVGLIEAAIESGLHTDERAMYTTRRQEAFMYGHALENEVHAIWPYTGYRRTSTMLEPWEQIIRESGDVRGAIMDMIENVTIPVSAFSMFDTEIAPIDGGGQESNDEIMIALMEVSTEFMKKRVKEMEEY